MDAASRNYVPSHAQAAERSGLWIMRDHIDPLEKNIAVFNADATTHGWICLYGH
jgi:hypothetical protein